MLVVEHRAVLRVPREQTEADVEALQPIDLRIITYLAGLSLDAGWQSSDEIAAALCVQRHSICWRPMGRLAALELVEHNDRIPLRHGMLYRVTVRGAAVAELVRNPSAASEETRDHLRFLSITPELEPAG